MSVQLAKLAVALLYAATVIAVFQEMSGHHGPDLHREHLGRHHVGVELQATRDEEGQSIRAPTARRAAFDGILLPKRQLNLNYLILGLIAFDSSAHEHPTEHRKIEARRRGRRSNWNGPIIINLRGRLNCNSPPLELLMGYPPRIIRRGAAQMIIA